MSKYLYEINPTSAALMFIDLRYNNPFHKVSKVLCGKEITNMMK